MSPRPNTAPSELPSVFDPATVHETAPWWSRIPRSNVQAAIHHFRNVLVEVAELSNAETLPPPRPRIHGISTPAAEDVQLHAHQHAAAAEYATPPRQPSTSPSFEELVEATSTNALPSLASIVAGVWRTPCPPHSAPPVDILGDPTAVGGAGRVHVCQWTDCPVAEVPFASSQALTDHVAEYHVPRRQPVYYCAWDGCRRGEHPFRQRDKMVVHIRLHTDVGRYRCTVPNCGREFSRIDSYEDHQKVHASVGRDCHCPVAGCNRAYFHSKSLRKHMRSVHDVAM